MSVLGRIHAIGTAAINIGCALVRMAFALAMIGGCIWVWEAGYRSWIVVTVLGLVAMFGLTDIIAALGVFGLPEPNYDRAARREVRKALRRHRMMGWW
jgi:glucose dehydrogenase